MLVVPAIPGLAWLWAFYRTDRYQPEPPRLVALTFLLGALSTLPAVGAEVLAARAYPFLGHVEKAMLGTGTAIPLLPIAIGCFVVIGPIEELAKFLVVRLWIYRRPEFDEPIDGIVYASAAALGFASFENALYVLDFRHHDVRWALLFSRAFLAVPGHVLFSSMWGYALGRARFKPYPVALMVVAASVLHASYDFLALLPVTRPLVLILVVALFVIVGVQIRALSADSPFRPRSPLSRITIIPAIALAPTRSATSLARAHVCVGCGLAADPNAKFCGGCGAPL
jgi:RsiW-degrading membrane proteinase PrsW (M82 family)